MGLLGKNTLQIVLDQQVVQPGQVLSGTLTLDVHSKISLYVLCVYIFGKEKSWWTVGESDEKRYIKNTRDVLNKTLYLVGEDTGTKKPPPKTQIPPGHYEYRFEYAIPVDIDLPPTLEIGKAGITYGVWAHIEDSSTWAANRKRTTKRKKSSQVREVFEPFTMVGNFLPLGVPVRAKKIDLTMKKKFKLGSDALTINVKMDKDVFLPGDTVGMKIKVNNDTNIEIKFVETFLQPYFYQSAGKGQEVTQRMPFLFKEKQENSKLKGKTVAEWDWQVSLREDVFPTVKSSQIVRYYHVIMLRVHPSGESFLEIAVPITIVCRHLAHTVEEAVEEDLPEMEQAEGSKGGKGGKSKGCIIL